MRSTVPETAITILLSTNPLTMKHALDSQKTRSVALLLLHGVDPALMIPPLSLHSHLADVMMKARALEKAAEGWFAAWLATWELLSQEVCPSLPVSTMTADVKSIVQSFYCTGHANRLCLSVSKRHWSGRSLSVSKRASLMREKMKGKMREKMKEKMGDGAGEYEEEYEDTMREKMKEKMKKKVKEKNKNIHI